MVSILMHSPTMFKLRLPPVRQVITNGLSTVIVLMWYKLGEIAISAKFYYPADYYATSRCVIFLLFFFLFLFCLFVCLFLTIEGGIGVC